MLDAVLDFSTTLLQRGHFHAAAAACSGALHGRPGDVAIRLLRARAHLALGHELEVQADLREVVRLDPTCGAAYRLLGELATRRKERASATIFFREALRLDPTDREAAAWLRALGRTKFGPYSVFEKLGTGGMAVVHRAELRGHGPVALKRMLPQFAADRDVVAAFVHEAELLSRLRHDGIARVVDHGRIGETPYIAMELVDGQTLRDAMERSVLPLVNTVEILIQLCDALDHAHTRRDDHGRPLGIVHRDVSPSNVILARTGSAKLIDFGIAKAATQSWETRAGIVKGKLAYVAPEYIGGQLDARADLFAVGVVAHEMLTGQPLFHGANAHDTLVNVLEKAVPRPSTINGSVSRTLDDIVMVALEREPARRWQSAAALRNALLGVSRENTWSLAPTMAA